MDEVEQLNRGSGGKFRAPCVGVPLHLIVWPACFWTG